MSGSAQKYCKNKTALNNGGHINDFTNDNNSVSFKLKLKITGQTRNNRTKHVQIMVPLQYQGNFWRTLEMPLINCEVIFFYEKRWISRHVIRYIRCQFNRKSIKGKGERRATEGTIRPGEQVKARLKQAKIFNAT